MAESVSVGTYVRAGSSTAARGLWPWLWHRTREWHAPVNVLLATPTLVVDDVHSARAAHCTRASAFQAQPGMRCADKPDLQFWL